MKLLLTILLLASIARAQGWVRTEYRDELHNESGVKFFLSAKEGAGGIEVSCSKGQLKAAWLLTDKVADAQAKSDTFGNTSTEVDVEYRRGDEAKAHHLSLPVSNDFHGILLQQPHHGFAAQGSVAASRGLELLLYGPMGFGGGEWRRNKKANNWAHRLIVGVSAYVDSDSVFTFEVPDPTPVFSECGMK